MTYNPREQIIVSLTGGSISEMKSQTDEAIRRGAKLVELACDRVEEFKEQQLNVQGLRHLLFYRSGEVIKFIRFRKDEEAGISPGQGFVLRETHDNPNANEGMRLGYIHTAMKSVGANNSRFVFDVELSALEALGVMPLGFVPQIMATKHDFRSILQRGAVRRIYRDFDETPGLWGMKFAAIARDYSEAVSSLELSASHKGSRKLITHSLGAYGVVTRILNLFYGSNFTYSCLDRKRASADGQIPFEDSVRMIEEVGRWRAGSLKQVDSLTGLDLEKYAERLGVHVSQLK